MLIYHLPCQTYIRQRNFIAHYSPSSTGVCFLVGNSLLGLDGETHLGIVYRRHRPRVNGQLCFNYRQQFDARAN